jgi:hypothetical protein
MTRITVSSNEDQCTIMIMSSSVALRIVNVSDKFEEKIKTHFIFINVFPYSVSFTR